jgi:hypothetical protein
MKHLASAVVDALVFLQLSEDDVVDPDAAVDLTESLTAVLRECSMPERNALKAVIDEKLAEEKNTGASAETLEFYETLMDNVFADD